MLLVVTLAPKSEVVDTDKLVADVRAASKSRAPVMVMASNLAVEPTFPGIGLCCYYL